MIYVHITLVVVLPGLFLYSNPDPPVHPTFRLAQAIFKPNPFPHTHPTFSTPVLLHTSPPMKMEHTQCTETSAYKIQTSENYPSESTQQDTNSWINHAVQLLCHVTLAVPNNAKHIFRRVKKHAPS